MTKLEKGVEVGAFIKESNLEIKKIHNEKWITNKILHPRAQRPGIALAGYSKYLNKKRMQVFGKTEMGYLNQLSDEDFEKNLKTFISLKLPAVIISENQEINDTFISIALKYKTPILVSSLVTSLLISRVSSSLYSHFSKTIRINGVLVDIMGQGVLITGESGIGKSETALELVNKGHHLISDDLIEFYLDSNDEPVGRSVETIKNWLEVRGLGIINICDMFGVGAILEEKKLDLVINLEKWNPKKKYERLGEDALYFSVLGKKIPQFKLPVALGRNLSTLIEVAVKYFISKKRGSPSFLEHLNGKVEK